MVKYWVVLLAAAAGFGFGGIWYRLLAKPWMGAHGFTSETMRRHHGKGASKWPFAIAIMASIVMAFVLAGLIGHIGAFTVRGGMISGAISWAGFVLTTIAVNNTFAMRNPKLIAIDGGHWLGVLLVMGAIIGGLGA